MANFQFSSYLTYWQHLTWVIVCLFLEAFLHVAPSARHSCRLLLLTFEFRLLVPLRLLSFFHWGVCSKAQCLVFSFLSKFTPLMILLIPKLLCTIYIASVPNFVAPVLISLPTCSIVYLTDRCFDFKLSKTEFLIFPTKTSPCSLNQLKWCQLHLSICSVQKLRITLNVSFSSHTLPLVHQKALVIQHSNVVYLELYDYIPPLLLLLYSEPLSPLTWINRSV